MLFINITINAMRVYFDRFVRSIKLEFNIRVPVMFIHSRCDLATGGLCLLIKKHSPDT